MRKQRQLEAKSQKDRLQLGSLPQDNGGAIVGASRGVPRPRSRNKPQSPPRTADPATLARSASARSAISVAPLEVAGQATDYTVVRRIAQREAILDLLRAEVVSGSLAREGGRAGRGRPP